MSRTGEPDVGDATGSIAMPAPPLYAMPAGTVRPLRMVMLLPERIPGWVAAFLGLAAENDWIDVAVLRTGAAGSMPVPRWAMDLRALLAAERLRGRRGGVSLAPVASAALPQAVLATDLDSDPGRLRSRILGLQPDVVLALAGAAHGPMLAACARWGCWLLDANLTHPERAGLPLLAPMLRADTATALELELHFPPAPPELLACSWGATRHGSFALQRERAFLKLAPLLLRAMHRLADGRMALPERTLATLRLRPPAPALGMIAGARAIATTLRATASWRRKRRQPQTWMLAFRRADALLDPDAPVMGENTTLCSPRGYWADPCVVEASGRLLLFVEEWNPQARKGEIACLELDGEQVRRLGLALDEPCHLSFPQPFQWQGDWYLTVESSQARRISLYRAAAFPLRWQRLCDLVTHRVCVDPVLHFHEGRWYLFANVAENGNSTWDELFLFVGETLTGPFRPHPCNPIVSDVRRARLAGRLFRRDGRLIRPAQDCAPGYGAAVVFHEVQELGPDRYRERVLSRLAPDWDAALDGCHTYSTAGCVEVLDLHGHATASAAPSRIADTATAPVLPA